MEAATVGLMLADVGLKEMSRSSAERLRYASLAHGLRTPNECINQRNLEIWADVADKICFGGT